ncbi:hypothetical protein EL09_22595 [Salmonella enterica subsp. enterica]|nr:hypothetical protein [Salmonella enterica subsp. enterica]MIF52458.1 hypothetical protein [Salmonella enterica subsp. enterica]
MTRVWTVELRSALCISAHIHYRNQYGDRPRVNLAGISGNRKLTNFKEVFMPDDCDLATMHIEFLDSLRARRPVPSLRQIVVSERTCASCGVIIPVERLEKVPDAELCFDCQTLSEIREATFRRNFR